MDILLVTNVFSPDFCGGASLFTDLAMDLEQRGHRVWVLTTYPYYPEWRRKSTEPVWQIAHETLGQNIRVSRHGMYIPRRPSSVLGRLLMEVSFAASLLRSLFRGPRQAVVVAFCPLFAVTLFGIARKWLRGAPLWINIQDIPADAAMAAGITRRGPLQRVLEFVQSLVFSQADVCSTLSQEMQRRVQSIVARHSHVVCCPNWLPDELTRKPPAPTPELAAALSANGERQAEGEIAASPVPAIPWNQEAKLKLLYCGNIGRKQGLLALCKALHNSHISFDLCIHGKGTGRGEIESWIRQTRDARFGLGEFLETNQFLAAIDSADMFLTCEKAGSGFSFVPSKLIPAISLGTPILAISDASSPLGREVIQHQLGIHASWDEIAELPRRLQDFQVEREQLRANCLRRADFYSRDRVLTLYEQTIGDLWQRRQHHQQPEAAHAMVSPTANKQSHWNDTDTTASRANSPAS